jgi:predicted dehydrogenase
MVIPAILETQDAELVAIASRSLDKARTMASQFDAPAAYGSYEELLADPQVQAVYIPLPNNLHKPWSIAALRAGKHVLCEKPIALDAGEAREMQAAAEAAGRLLLEALMYRFTPLMRKAMRLIRDRALGEIQAIHTVFSVMMRDEPGNFRLQATLGGGAMYDLGCYCISVQRMLAGREPHTAWAHLTWSHETGIDTGGVGALDFGHGLQGTFNIGMYVRWDNYFRVSGTEGTLEAPIGFLGRERRPFLTLWHSRRPRDATDPPKPYMVERNWSERITVEPANPYLLEVEDACAAIRGERSPLYGSEPLNANMRVIDACFASDQAGHAVRV